MLYSVADHTGDSYGLAKKARESNAAVIVFASVRFMAETAKILNPDKVVLDPNPDGGCTLADGITAEDVKSLRTQFPDHTFVCYINTTAEVKALCDTCVTSSNVYKVIERIKNDKIYLYLVILNNYAVLEKYKKNLKVAKETIKKIKELHKKYASKLDFKESSLEDIENFL